MTKSEKRAKVRRREMRQKKSIKRERERKRGCRGSRVAEDSEIVRKEFTRQMEAVGASHDRSEAGSERAGPGRRTRHRIGRQ